MWWKHVSKVRCDSGVACEDRTWLASTGAYAFKASHVSTNKPIFFYNVVRYAPKYTIPPGLGSLADNGGYICNESSDDTMGA